MSDGFPSDDRLLELLTALGSVDAARLQEALGEVRAARARGERVDAASLLVERGVVPRGLLEALLGGGEDQPRAGEGRTPDEAERPRRSRKARRVEREDGEAPAPEPRVGRKSARRPRASGDALPRAAHSARAPIVVPAAEDEQTTSLDLETRRFDPAALAAASARRTRPWPAWVPAAAAGVALVLVVTSLVGVAGRLGASSPPPPVVDLPTPVPDPDEAAVESDAPALDDEPDDEPDGGEPPPPDPWPDLVARARALSDVERYAEARALLEGAPAEVRSAHAEELGPALERLRALEAMAAAADQVLREAEELRRRGEHDEAARRVQAVLDEFPDLAGSPTARRIEAARVEALEARAEAATTAEAPARPEPPERVAHFERQAARGRELVAAIQARVRRDQARAEELRRAEAARARAASEREPLRLELAPGYVVEGAVIDAMDDRGFTVRAGGSADTITRTWSSVPDEVALKVRRLAVREEVAEDHLRLGRWCLANHHFEEARQAFARAVALDPKLMGQVPDVSDIARSGRLFSGRSQHSGTSLEVVYDFARPAEARDFQDEPGARGVLREGRLEVRGRSSFLTALTEVGFNERLEVAASLGPASRDALSVVGVSFDFGTRREVTWLVAVARGSGDLMLLRRQDGRVRRLERKPGALKGNATHVSLELGPGELRVRAQRRTQLKVPVGRWDSVRVVLGGVAPADGAGSIESLTVRGTVRPEWLRKAVGELDARLRALLARSEELPVFVAPSVRPAPPPLSAEDEFGLEGVRPEALDAYREGRVKAAAGGPLDLLAAASAFERALELSPRFAAAAYRRALVMVALGRPHAALVGLEQAIAQCPRFYEAMAERARLLAGLGRLDEARAAADEAIAIRPDHAPAWAARASSWFLAGELERALADLDVALGLDPWNDEVRARRKNVVHVLAGPPWARPYRRETEHYVVMTDISQRRCDEYARDLEAVRRFFAARFGLAADAPPPEGRKATVLIFDTREGFHAYAELTTDDRVESLLGCYLPRYRQLLLFEDKDDATLEETRRVLFHEAFHQFMDGLVSDLPYWLNEGLAEYFSTCRVEPDGRVTPPGAASRLEPRIEELRRYVARDAVPVPFKAIMNESPAQFYSGPVAAKYAQAWAMVHFFEHGGSRELAERFRRYVAALREGMAARAAFHAAWDGVDWGAVEGAWLQYVKRL